jgi:cytochrome P450
MSPSISIVPHLPLIGNALDILGNPPEFLNNIARTHGDIVQYKAFHESLYLINHPDGIRRVLVENSRNYSINDRTRQLLALTLGDGLFVSEGALWLRQRRLMQPLFHQRYVDLFSGAMIQTTHERIEQWRHEQSKDASYKVDITHEMMELTVRIAVRALFGVDIRDDVSVVGEAVTTIIRLFSMWIRSSLILFLPFSVLKALPQYRQAVGELNRVVYRLINERRQHNFEKNDLLGLLMTSQDQETGEFMSDRQLRDEVTTLLIAGHETTATALSWLFYNIAIFPEIRERLYKEVLSVVGQRDITVQDLENLPFTKMVAAETLRLYPPAWVMFRRTLSNDEIEGVPIPANRFITISPFAIHRHPRYWSNPDKFYPEHFLPEVVKERHPFAYIPFGSGPRQCIGRHFAITEIQIVVAMIAQSFELIPYSATPAKVDALLTLRPKSPVYMNLGTSPQITREGVG